MRKSTSSSELRFMLSALRCGNDFKLIAVCMTSLMRLLFRLSDSMPLSMLRSLGRALILFSAKLS